MVLLSDVLDESSTCDCEIECVCIFGCDCEDCGCEECAEESIFDDEQQWNY